MNNLSNTQVTNTSRNLLLALDQQRKFLIREYGIPMPCPSCDHPVTAWASRGETFDQHDFTNDPDAGRECPNCHRPLTRAVFMTGGWAWQIDHAREETAADSQPTP